MAKEGEAPNLAENIPNVISNELRHRKNDAPKSHYKSFGSSGLQERTHQQDVLHQLIRKGKQSGFNLISSRVKWMTFPVFGHSKASFLPRLVGLWAIALPVIVLKMAIVVFMFVLATGVVTTAFAGAATGGAMASQYYYRDVLEWAKTNDEFQHAWDIMAMLLALILNIILYFVRLTQEIWNGFCPLLAMFVDLMYEMLKQLATIWFAAPVLQYMLFWLVRLVIFVSEPFFDALVTCAEAFVDFAQDMTVGLSSVIADEVKAQTGRRPLSMSEIAGDAAVEIGEVLLHIAVAILTLIIRLVEALVVCFLPLIYSFLRLVLPKIIKYIPPVFEIVAKVASIFTSDPVRRIFDFVVQALPIVLEFVQGLVCAVVVYLGAIACYILYAICIVFGFYLRYIVRPCVCGAAAILGGCFKAFIRAAMDGDDCFACGRYHTSCGCRADARPTGGCGGSCNDGGEGTDTKAPPDAPRTDRTEYKKDGKQSSSSQAFTSDSTSTHDMYRARNYGDDQQADIGEGSVTASVTKNGQAWDECNYEADPSCGSASVSSSDSYKLTQTDMRRRRSSPDGSPSSGGAAPLPPGITLQPAPPPFNSGSGTLGSHSVTSTTTYAAGHRQLLSNKASVTASAGFYASAYVDFDDASQLVVKWGSQPHLSAAAVSKIIDENYQYSPTDLQCKSMPGTNPRDYTRNECDLVGVSEALADHVFASPASVLSGGSGWQAADWGRDAWLSVRLDKVYNVQQLKATWKVVQGKVLGPHALTITVKSPSPVVYNPSALACTTTQLSRIDVIDTDAVASQIRIDMPHSSVCGTDNGAEQHQDHLPPLYLSSLTVWGSEQSSQMSDTVNWYHNASVYAKTTVAEVADGVGMWDACGKGAPVSLSDGLHWPPSVFYTKLTTAGPKFALDIAATRVNSEGTEYTPHINVTSITVHLGASSYLPTSGVVLCPENAPHTSSKCLLPDAAATTDTLSGYTTVAREANDAALGLSSSQRAAFWRSDYPGDPKWKAPSRGASITWNLNQEQLRDLQSDSGYNNKYRLWFASNWYENLYVTDWQTAATELGVSTAHYVEAQWLLQIQSGLQPDGIVSNAVAPEEFCAHAQSYTKGPGAGTYTSPFGASTSHAAWFAVTEVEMFGPYPNTLLSQSTLANRRLLAEETPLNDSLEDTMRRDLENRRAQRATQGPPDTRHTVQALMESRGLYRYKSEDDNYANVRRNPAESVIYEHQTRAAPDNGQYQPFASNLANMPNPQNEPVFYCSEYTVANNSRMRCWEKKPPLLSASNATVQNASDIASDNGNWATTLFTNQPELQQQLSKLNTAMEQRSLLRNLKFMQSVNAIEQQSKVVHVQHASSSRRLLVIPWGAIGDMITDMATSIGKALIKALQIAVTSAIACSAYCTPARKCNDNQDIGQCLKAFVVFIAQKIFRCNDDEDLYDCTIGKIIKWVLDLLMLLLDFLLTLIDLCGEIVASILGLGDLLKIIGCQACSLATIITGVLSDFASNFPLSMCLMLVDKGTTQCEKWGMGSIDDMGAAVFGNLIPMVKLLFGMIQVLPALVDVILEVVVLVFSKVVELFPAFLNDSFDILLWFITSSDVLDSLETLFASFDPILTEIQDMHDGLTGTKGSTNFEDITTKSGWSDNDADDVAFPGPSESQECFQAESSSGGNCGQKYQNGGDDIFSNKQTSTASKQHAQEARAGSAAERDVARTDPDNAEVDLEFDLGGCGCRVSRQQCEEGPGTGDCPVKDSKLRLRNKERQEKVAAAKATAGTDRSTWKQCQDTNTRTILPKHDFAKSSPEMKKTYIDQKKCWVQSHTNKDGKHVNFMAVEYEMARAEGKPSRFPFQQTSHRDPNKVTNITDEDFNLGAFEGWETPKYDPRRRSSSSRRMLNAIQAQHVMGISYLYPDTPLQEKERAQIEVEQIMMESNTTFAQEQILALTEDVTALGDLWHQILVNASRSLPDLDDIKVNLDKTVASARRLLGLGGFSGAEPQDLACGFSSMVGVSPNTYPCCQGLWCCFKPLIPRDFRFQKEWFAWKDDWVTNTRCMEFYTYSDGYLFLLRGTCKLARDISSSLVNVWPYSAMVTAIWSAFTFEDDVWPQSKLHQPPWDFAFQVTCLALNFGLYVPPIVLAVVLFIAGEPLLEWLFAHIVIYTDIFSQFDLQELEMLRREEEREMAEEAQSEKQKDRKASSESIL